ncbi:FAD-dependent oxidoreductase [Candidatus Woesearchaeota archaeon]|nr:FAD-dependent oxidoreductase [Candidatus Woesearchaeota archaeon]
MAEGKRYDLVIVGAGPAGLTAAIYAARYKLDSVVIGPDVGGTANLPHDIENWPGFKGAGWDLMAKFREHVESFGVQIVTEDVKSIEKKADHFAVSTEKNRYNASTVLLAMGTKRRKLDVPGEEELFGKGVSYCATCDCVFFKDKVVGVVGGADAAAMAAQILSQHAKKVYIIYRKDKMRAEPARVEELENDPKVEFVYNANVTEIVGDSKLDKVKLDTGNEMELDGLFIEIGGIPITSLAKELGIDLSDSQRIKVNAAMETNVHGVFAAGDITTGSNQFNQIVTASAEGALAALASFNYIRKHKVKGK